MTELEEIENEIATPCQWCSDYPKYSGPSHGYWCGFCGGSGRAATRIGPHTYYKDRDITLPPPYLDGAASIWGILDR